MSEQTAPLAQFLLAREELLVVLTLLKAGYILGLEPDPLGEGNNEQQARMLFQAERALRARELARLDEGGHLIVQNALLAAVGTCAYPHKNLVAHRFVTGQRTQRVFGHHRESNWVIRREPEGGLYLFEIFAEREPWLIQFLQAALCHQLPGATTPPLTLKGQALGQARTLAAADPAGAQQALRDGGLSAEEARWLANTLAQPLEVIVFHVITLQPDNSVGKQELTVMHNTEQAWLLVEPGETAGTDTYQLRPLTTTQLSAALGALL